MDPQPVYLRPDYKAAGKLEGRVAIVTGGDSGIGRSVAVLFAHEGADVAAMYLDEHGDAEKTEAEVEKSERKCLIIAGDVGDEAFCYQAVKRVIEEFGNLDCLFNNAAEQHVQKSIEDIRETQITDTFRVRHLFRLSGIERFVVYRRTNAASQRRRNRRGVNIEK